MESTPPAINRNEEAKLLARNEGSIASRLRSRFKAVGDHVSTYTGGNNKTGKLLSRLSRHQKDKGNNNSAVQKSEAIQIEKKNDSKPKAKSKSIEVHNLSSRKATTCVSFKRGTLTSQQNSKIQKEPTKITNMSNNGGGGGGGGGGPSSSSYNVGKEKEKAGLSEKSMKEHPIHYIRWKGFEKTSSPRWNCSLCKKDVACLTNEEKRKHSSREENELQYSLFSHAAGEESGSLLPEVAVLPCSHVFHSTCLSALHPANLTDPPCPICLTML